MFSKDGMVLDLDNIELIIRVILLQMLKYMEFNSCLVLVSLFISDDLDRH